MCVSEYVQYLGTHVLLLVRPTLLETSALAVWPGAVLAPGRDVL